MAKTNCTQHVIAIPAMTNFSKVIKPFLLEFKPSTFFFSHGNFYYANRSLFDLLRLLSQMVASLIGPAHMGLQSHLANACWYLAHLSQSQRAPRWYQNGAPSAIFHVDMGPSFSRTRKRRFYYRRTGRPLFGEENNDMHRRDIMVFELKTTPGCTPCFMLSVFNGQC